MDRADNPRLVVMRPSISVWTDVVGLGVGINDDRDRVDKNGRSAVPQVSAGTITSSPGFTPAALKAISRLASQIGYGNAELATVACQTRSQTRLPSMVDPGVIDTTFTVKNLQQGLLLFGPGMATAYLATVALPLRPMSGERNIHPPGLADPWIVFRNSSQFSTTLRKARAMLFDDLAF